MPDAESLASLEAQLATANLPANERLGLFLRLAARLEEAGRDAEAQERTAQAIALLRGQRIPPERAAEAVGVQLLGAGALRAALFATRVPDEAAATQPEAEPSIRLVLPLLRAGILVRLGAADEAKQELAGLQDWLREFFAPDVGLAPVPSDAWLQIAEALVSAENAASGGPRRFFEAMATALGASPSEEDLVVLSAIVECLRHAKSGSGPPPAGMLERVQAVAPPMAAILRLSASSAGTGASRPPTPAELSTADEAFATLEGTSREHALPLLRLLRGLLQTTRAIAEREPLALLHATGRALHAIAAARANARSNYDRFVLNQVLDDFFGGAREKRLGGVEGILLGCRTAALRRLVTAGRQEALRGALATEDPPIPDGCESQLAEYQLLLSCSAFELQDFAACERLFKSAAAVALRDGVPGGVRVRYVPEARRYVWLRFPGSSPFSGLPATAFRGIASQLPSALALIVGVVTEFAERSIALSAPARDARRCLKWCAWAEDMLRANEGLFDAPPAPAADPPPNLEAGWSELRCRLWKTAAGATIEAGSRSAIQHVLRQLVELLQLFSGPGLSNGTLTSCLLTATRLEARLGETGAAVAVLLSESEAGSLPTERIPLFMELLLAEDPEAAEHLLTTIDELCSGGVTPLRRVGPTLPPEQRSMLDVFESLFSVSEELARASRLRLWTPLWRAEALRLLNRPNEAVAVLDAALESIERADGASEGDDDQWFRGLARHAYRLACADVLLSPETGSLDEETHAAIVATLNALVDDSDVGQTAQWSPMAEFPAFLLVREALAARLLLACGDAQAALGFARGAVRLLATVRKDRSDLARFSRLLLPAAWPSRGLALRVWADVHDRLAGLAVDEATAKRHRSVRERSQRAFEQHAHGLWQQDRRFERLLCSESEVPADDNAVLRRALRALRDRCGNDNNAEAVALQEKMASEVEFETSLKRGDPARALQLAEERQDVFPRRDGVQLGAALPAESSASCSQIPIECPDTAAILLASRRDGRVQGFLWLPSADGRRLRAAALHLESTVSGLRETGNRIGEAFLAARGLEVTAARSLGEQFWTVPATLVPLANYQPPDGGGGHSTLLTLLERAGVHRLVIVLCPELAGVPFHVAELPDRRCVLEAVGVSYLPSPESARRVLSTVDVGRAPAAHLVNPTADLRHADCEGRALEQAIPDARALRHPSWPCTRTRFLGRARDLAWLHIAAHGVPAPNHAERLKAGIRLLPNTDDDGLVTVRDLVGNGAHPLQPGATVVLAACEAADPQNSPLLAEPASLARSLLDLVPCRRVMAPLWPVYDVATVALMERFYAGIGDQLPSWDALRRAQLALRSGELDARIQALHRQSPSSLRGGTRVRVAEPDPNPPGAARSDWAAWVLLGL